VYGDSKRTYGGAGRKSLNKIFGGVLAHD